jgi:hypothetical protein
VKDDQPLSPLETDLANLARLTANGSLRDVQLFLVRLARKSRVTSPALARRLDDSYKAIRKRTGLGGPLRRAPTGER